MERRNSTQSDGRSPALARAVLRVRRGFTILEMLIVIAIIAIATAVILPAFNRLVESSNFASSISTVTATLGNARALAIQNSEYTAVAFLFDTETETYTLLPLELSLAQSASMSLTAPAGDSNNQANAYRPARGSVPVTLPAGTGVYGLSFQTEPPGATLDSGVGSGPTLEWYAGEVIEDGSRVITPWIFPRNDPRHFTPRGRNPYDVIRGDVSGSVSDADTALRHAQSFMVQFSPQGTVVEALPGEGFPLFNGYIEYPDRPVDEENGDFDEATGRFEPYDDLRAFDPENRRFLGNDEDVDENPEVYLRAVSQLAVVSLDDLRSGADIAPEIDQVWFVRPGGDTNADVAPKRTDLFTTYYDNETVIAISDWIDDNAEIIGFNRYTGNVIRRTN
jgi:prepilin-type N-terminal cleavage/methylation domain-containing protein